MMHRSQSADQAGRVIKMIILINIKRDLDGRNTPLIRSLLMTLPPAMDDNSLSFAAFFLRSCLKIFFSEDKFEFYFLF